MTLKEYLKSIADAIRAKKGTTETINAQDFATEILNLPSGGGGGSGETLFFKIYNNTDYDFVINGFSCASQEYIDIPISFDSAYIQAILVMGQPELSEALNMNNRFRYTYDDSYEDEEGNIINEKATYNLVFIQVPPFSMYLAYGLGLPYESGTLITVEMFNDLELEPI